MSLYSAIESISIVKTNTVSTVLKKRLNKAWKNHPSKFCAQCYIPGIPTRIVQHPNASQEAELLE